MTTAFSELDAAGRGRETPKLRGRRGAWPDYAAVWRWHFYAGLFCLPFICWLAVTGSVYLFRPDIEAILDGPYESLHLAGAPASPSREAQAALAAVPGSSFSRYEPPATATGAPQVVVARGGRLWRVYVHPGTLAAMKVERDDLRPMELVSHLHGELLLGDRGSMLVEVAASWAVVMILTGFYLWLPRGRWWRLGGVLYPRIGAGGRLFWRDLHAVTGLWVSLVTLFLLLSGLPWAVSWGNYLTWARNRFAATAGAPDWPVGATDQPAAMRDRAAPRNGSSMPGMSRDEMSAMAPALRARTPPPADIRALDVVAPMAAHLHVPRPVWVSPPTKGARDWTLASQTQNRPLRVAYKIDPSSGRVTSRSGFGDENIVDKVVNVSVATHEGQLLGRLNQAVLLLTATGLVATSISAMVLWWRRRPTDTLGAPARGSRPRFSLALVALISALALLLPLFGLSLVLVLVVERALLPAHRRWLGISPRQA